MDRIINSYESSWQQLYARRASGQQHWEAETTFLQAANAFYFLMLTLLYLYMRDRPAFNPTFLMQLYNISCVVLAAM
jgi:hypothetical protein